MKRFLSYLFYNKCPNCKKRGIFIIGKVGYRYNIPCKCKFCGEKFKVESFSSMLLCVIVIIICIIITKILNIGLFGTIILILIFEYLIERFIPFEHVDK